LRRSGEVANGEDGCGDGGDQNEGGDDAGCGLAGPAAEEPSGDGEKEEGGEEADEGAGSGELGETQTSQMTVAKMGMETACLRTSIHAPGLGRMRAQPGK